MYAFKHAVSSLDIVLLCPFPKKPKKKETKKTWTLLSLAPPPPFSKQIRNYTPANVCPTISEPQAAPFSRSFTAIQSLNSSSVMLALASFHSTLPGL